MIWAAAIVVLIVLVGCGKGSDQSSVSSKPKEIRIDSSAITGKKIDNRKSQDDSSSKNSDVTIPEPQFKMTGQKISISWQENGQQKLTAKAIEATGNTISGKAALKKVNADLYENGKLVATLVAPLVEADEKTRVVTATGGVTITSKVPESTIRTVEADWIKWYSKDGKLVGNGGVKARGPVTSMDASAFVADTRLRNIRILANPAEARAVIGNR
jgi:hypothetical protein